MAAVRDYPYDPSGDPYVKSLLTGTTWASSSLTYSFRKSASFYDGYDDPETTDGEPSNDFKPFNSVQESAARTILAMYASFADITFTEVTESATTHGVLRWAEADNGDTAWTYLPSAEPSGGDMWFNNSSGEYDDPVRGSYAWDTIIHELGHALGLKHPHQASPPFPKMPIDHNSLEYTVMSYRSYIGGSTSGGYTNLPSSYPQTPMMYDISAIQKLYGPNYSFMAGNTVYKWSPSTGETFVNGAGQGAPLTNKIFLTVWDGGGNDTYDFSNYTTSLKVDLEPGDWTTTSSSQRANLGSGHTAIGNIANALLYDNNPQSLIENAIGGSGNDTIVGNAASNRLTGGAGNDTLNGDGGTDTAIYSGARSGYLVTDNGNSSWRIVDIRSGSLDGTDTLRNIQKIQFADQTVAIATALDHAPVAHADSYSTRKATKLVCPAGGVLGNNSDPDGNPIHAVLVSGPERGKLIFDGDGSFTYKPPKHFKGKVTFSYEASDGALDSNVATVTVSVGHQKKVASNLPAQAAAAPLHPSSAATNEFAFVDDGDSILGITMPITPKPGGRMCWRAAFRSIRRASICPTSIRADCSSISERLLSAPLGRETDASVAIPNPRPTPSSWDAGERERPRSVRIAKPGGARGSPHRGS